MHGTISKIILMLVVVLSFCLPSVCLAKSDKRLMTINSIEFTSDDFMTWWEHWNDKNDLKFPDSPDDFIDFQLLVQQGREMGYDSKASYLRKLDIFLQVRTMMALKYEEIDSKISVTDDDLRQYFGKNYSELWVLQILAFDSESKAQKAYDFMLPFKGQVAGRLVFADLTGGSTDEKADSYDEVKICVDDFHKNKKDVWLSIVRKLEAGEVSQPFSSDDKYLVLRLVEKQMAPESLFEKNKNKIAELLYKQKKNELTGALLEKLKIKYNVKVDRELYDQIKLDVDYPKEFLERKLLTMSGFEATVGGFIRSALSEKKTRKNLADEGLKEIVLDTFISQNLINKESLARGYEKRPPMLAVYEFYKQSRLRLEVQGGLLDGIVVSDQDLRDYYERHIASYSVPDKFTFYLLNGDENVLKKIWFGTLQGEDFEELAKKYSLDASRQTQGVDSLSPVVVSELKKLDIGGVSLPFAIDGNYVLLKFVDRLPGHVQPLAEVKSNVLEQLKKEKFEIVKAEYLAKLKSRSKIDINERVWNGLVREQRNGKKD